MTRKERKKLKKKPHRLKISTTKMEELAWMLARYVSKLPPEHDDHKHFCGVCRMYYCNGKHYCHDCAYTRNFPEACLKVSKGVETCVICKRGW